MLAIALPLVEIGISFLPGVERASRATTVVEWFTLFQNNWFLGLRNLGLLNIIGAALLAPTFLAIYCALRRNNDAYAAFGAVLYFVGIAVYLANSRAFPMLSLSRQYAGAGTDAQKSLLVVAGQAMLAEGQSRPGILLIEFAGVIVSAVMLRSKVFSKVTAYAGILGNALLMVVEIILTFLGKLPGMGMVIAIGAGFAMMTWYFLVGRRLLQLQ